MNTVIYSRVSTTQQTIKGHSLKAQNDMLIEYCKFNQLENIIHLSDEGISGKTINKRPAFMKLIEMVKNKEVSNVVVPSLSRFCRSAKDTLNTLDLFQKYNVRFHSLNENIDTDSAIGKCILTIISAINQLEVQQTSERISAVLQHRKSKGYCIGSVPFGYDKLPDKSLVKNRSEQNTIKLIKTMKESGQTFDSIADELKRLKRKNKNGKCSWNKSQVWRIYNN